MSDLSELKTQVAALLQEAFFKLYGYERKITINPKVGLSQTSNHSVLTFGTTIPILTSLIDLGITKEDISESLENIKQSNSSVKRKFPVAKSSCENCSSKLVVSPWGQVQIEVACQADDPKLAAVQDILVSLIAEFRNDEEAYTANQTQLEVDTAILAIAAKLNARVSGGELGFHVAVFLRNSSLNSFFDKVMAGLPETVDSVARENLWQKLQDNTRGMEKNLSRGRPTHLFIDRPMAETLAQTTARFRDIEQIRTAGTPPSRG